MLPSILRLHSVFHTEVKCCGCVCVYIVCHFEALVRGFNPPFVCQYFLPAHLHWECFLCHLSLECVSSSSQLSLPVLCVWVYLLYDLLCRMTWLPVRYAISSKNNFNQFLLSTLQSPSVAIRSYMQAIYADLASAVSSPLLQLQLLVETAWCDCCRKKRFAIQVDFSCLVANP